MIRYSMSDSWSELFGLVPAIYCISLITNVKRREKVNKLFARLDIESRVQYVYDRPKPTDVKCSCRVIYKHLEIYRQALKLNYDRIFIFEDDAVLARDITKSDIDSIKLLLDPKYMRKWSSLQFGYDDTSYSINKNLSGDIYGINCLHAHAYMISRQGMTRILENWRTPLHPLHIGAIDTFFLIDPDIYAFKNRIFRQEIDSVKMKENKPMSMIRARIANYIYWNRLEVVVVLSLIIVVYILYAAYRPHLTIDDWRRG